MAVLNSVPRFGDKNTDVRELQAALKLKGFDPGLIDGDFGPKTRTALQLFQKSVGLAGSGVIPSDGGLTFKHLGLTLKKQKKTVIPPWLMKAKEHDGKHENTPAFNRMMSSLWHLVGLGWLKTISGSAAAWCGLFGAAALFWAGMQFPSDGGRAINWDKFGVAIDYRTQGLPQGAFVRINSRGNCTSGAGNHVTMANGNCTPEHMRRAGATFDGYGGNQGDRAKNSTYRVDRICSVRWPKDFPPPERVTVNDRCTSGSSGTESTR